MGAAQHWQEVSVEGNVKDPQSLSLSPSLSSKVPFSDVGPGTWLTSGMDGFVSCCMLCVLLYAQPCL